MMSLFRVICAGLLSCLLCVGAGAQTAGRAQIETLIDDFLAEHDVPGAIVLIEHGSQRVVFAQGLAERETGRPMSADHLLRMASVGKVYTAAVIHRMVLDGSLDLDGQLGQYIEPAWLTGIANADTVTVRQLLNHTSGIPDYYDDDWFATVDAEHVNTAQNTLDSIRQQPALFAPGTEYAYSNSNYQFLGLIAEQVSGRPLGELMQEIIFTPLQLADTGYNIQFAPNDLIHGYGSTLDPEVDTYLLQENMGPDGGVFATADEAADVLNALFAADGELADIGQSMLSDKFEHGEGRYRALGPSFTEHEIGFDYVAHGGSIAGYATIAIRLMSPEIVIIAHINRDRPDLASALVRDLLLLRLSAGAAE
ncbi:serine hydrolase domain-containing protein [Maricaulis sp.]|uniref:serine hydrolase domain-containing protein n=1 Tax=Maricaulis sp. TaxID=1486257 RepID=UPI00260C9AA5|nr:serine hydrolase domain-containing protein [Maricaulis sp.]